MHPTNPSSSKLSKALRLTCRRLAAMVLALAMSIGLALTAAPAAQADPAQQLTIWSWDISDLEDGGDAAHQSYWNMVDALHRISGHDVAGQPRLDETTDAPARLIQIRLQYHEQYWGSLYFWANNLYFAGFYQPGFDGREDHHYSFNNVWPGEFNRVLGVTSTPLPWGGNYNQLPHGSTVDRSQDAITPYNLVNALGSLRNAPRYIATPAGRDTLGRNIVRIIQATAEAARFSTVFDRIRDNIRNWHTVAMGMDNIELQQDWDRISGWVYRALRPGDQAVLRIGAHTFATLQALLAYVGYMELYSGSRPRT
ncbi:ribosome-inactivating family protein [Streptomyces sp. NPDC006334]|uniref:ribosome-inactivating family protein n=1 Tax=Streptomyces sp. NPDC006334 TaxID=3156754 RepID=UPI0033BE1872